jgi:hypothetical protein
MFRNKDGGYHVNRQKVLGRGYGFDKILSDEDMRGRWTDILAHVRWAHTGEGRFEVWANGRKAYDYRGPTLSKGASVYFKFGIYRAFVSKYMLAKRTVRLPVQVVYFDEIRRGKTRAEVTRFLK